MNHVSSSVGAEKNGMMIIYNMKIQHEGKKEEDDGVFWLCVFT